MQPSNRLLRIGLAVAILAASTSAFANVTVILQSGSRIEATAAYATPRGWVLDLPGGGSLTLASQSVRRVSHAATDLPEARTLGLATSSPMASGSSAASTASGDGTERPLRRAVGYRIDSEDIRLPRSASLVAQGAPGEAPRGIMPTADQAAARQAAQRAASTNPLTTSFQRYAPDAGGSPTDSTLRDPLATAGMHRAFGRNLR